MPIETQKYRINDKDVIHEDYPDETILANLVIGAYYTLDLVGADFLEALTLAPNVQTSERWLVTLYPSDPGELKTLLADFIQACIDENLLVAQPGNETDPAAPVPTSLQASATSLRKPVLTKYLDIEDLLKFDPIHEVDHETGWPSLADD